MSAGVCHKAESLAVEHIGRHDTGELEVNARIFHSERAEESLREKLSFRQASTKTIHAQLYFRTWNPEPGHRQSGFTFCSVNVLQVAKLYAVAEMRCM